VAIFLKKTANLFFPQVKIEAIKAGKITLRGAMHGTWADRGKGIHKDMCADRGRATNIKLEANPLIKTKKRLEGNPLYKT
jgi:hypothetical protein